MPHWRQQTMIAGTKDMMTSVDQVIAVLKATSSQNIIKAAIPKIAAHVGPSPQSNALEFVLITNPDFLNRKQVGNCSPHRKIHQMNRFFVTIAFLLHYPAGQKSRRLARSSTAYLKEGSYSDAITTLKDAMSSTQKLNRMGKTAIAYSAKGHPSCLKRHSAFARLKTEPRPITTMVLCFLATDALKSRPYSSNSTMIYHTEYRPGLNNLGQASSTK